MFDTLESAEKFVDLYNKNFDCKIILDFWNIFNDIVYLFGEKIPDEYTRRSNRCYNKLFFGNNLPAFTPDREHYTPIFIRKERNNIRRMLSYGIDFIYKNME
ncbi:MAG: hypothetical protein K2H19_06230 [Ruminococcus sp.]|nr:hypothetical protein [Ruminococcus sp.]